MFHFKNTSSFILIIISSLTLCSSFLIEPKDLEISYMPSRIIKPKKQINIFTTITGDQVVGNEVKLIAKLDKYYNQTIQVDLVCKGDKCLNILGAKRFGVQSFDEADKKIEWKLKLNDNGLANLFVEPLNLDDFDDDVEINNAHSSQQLKIGRSYALNTWSMIIGYIYFVAWMLSLYPILFTNFNRRSVIGLNLDFVALNTTGYLSYSIYNICLFFIYEFQEAYYENFPGSQIPVQFNDVLFATHGFIINVLICVQCIFYERGNQSITDIAKGLLIAIYSPAIILTVFFICDGVNKYYYISFFSYCKLMLTLFKYIPQAYFNYKRKSTDGFTIVYCFLDITGGSFSILQMLLNSINQDDYRNFTGNIGKVGLGLVSILFDILFIVQHYVLYRHKDDLILETQTTYGSHSSKPFALRQNVKNSLQVDTLNSSISYDRRRSSNSGIRNHAYDES